VSGLTRLDGVTTLFSLHDALMFGFGQQADALLSCGPPINDDDIVRYV
jgi:hypothetical protein